MNIPNASPASQDANITMVDTVAHSLKSLPSPPKSPLEAPEKSVIDASIETAEKEVDESVTVFDVNTVKEFLKAKQQQQAEETPSVLLSGTSSEAPAPAIPTTSLPRKQPTQKKPLKKLSSQSGSLQPLSNRTSVQVVGTETRVQLKTSPGAVTRRSNILKRTMESGGETSPESIQQQSEHALVIKQGKKMFTVYKIFIKNGDQSWTIYKRYSEFDDLDKVIQKQFPYIHKHLPELPPKRFLWDNMDPNFIEHRAKGLHRYMQQLLTSPVLLRSQPVREFLCGGSIYRISQPSGRRNAEMTSAVNAQNEEDDAAADASMAELRNIHIESPKSILKPKAVFSTPSVTALNNTANKSALKKTSSLKRTLKKVAWRKTVFEISNPSPSTSPDTSPTTSTRPSTTSMISTSTDSSTGSGVSLDDFFLLKLIGKGNFGKVMLAQHKTDSKVYAIKVISKATVRQKSGKKSNPHDFDHIMTERNVLIRSVRHPFLIGLKWAFQTREKLYFVTDYVNGGELFFHLQRERRFSELRARFYAAEITSALAYLHAEVDVVYRDLKPENILLDSEGHIKLTDFGLAKENFVQCNRGRTQTFCGTPEYLAPEVIRKEPYGFPVDWWCLGSVLYEMLVGLPPFYSNDTQEMYDKILNEKLRFPPYVGIRARSAICGLLHRSPYFRLGTGQNNTSNPDAVKSHPFFEGIDWDKLYRREYQPPFIPTVSHLYDLRNIDPQFVNEPIPQSIVEDNALQSAIKNGFQVEVSTHHYPAGGLTFKGFTYLGEDESWLDRASESSDLEC